MAKAHLASVAAGFRSYSQCLSLSSCSCLVVGCVAGFPSPSGKPVDPADETTFWVILMLLMASIIIMLLVCAIFVRAVSRRREQEEEELEMAMMAEQAANPAGLSEEHISRLPTLPFSKTDCKANEQRNAECIISMDAFEEGETIIRLPCEHQLTYHLGVQYFQNNKKCPLCRKDIAEWMAAQEAQAASAAGEAEAEVAGHSGASALAGASSAAASILVSRSALDAMPVDRGVLVGAAVVQPAAPVAAVRGSGASNASRVFGAGGGRRVHPMALASLTPRSHVSFENPIRSGTSHRADASERAGLAAAGSTVDL